MIGSTPGARATIKEFEDLLTAISQKKILPMVDRTFPLSQAAEAQKYFKESGKLGKVLLLPPQHMRVN
ncbi:zinc-binding dehydrogenase [Alteribacillus iranensis]|uniref:zinc-binding dehydrogenase n=1 Tax=Alteribacillus iranensis TaxID=930128 RepID=UPI002ADD7C21|nr:zinc-binding dehydrogenase [Alteribacillus iranensis]